MVVAGGRLDEVVPLEPAAMPGRVVIQWDEDDCADLGIIEIDLLGLGVLGAIAEMVPTIRSVEGVRVDLAHLPHDDPAVFEFLNKADTVGLFQVPRSESRRATYSGPTTARGRRTTARISTKRWRGRVLLRDIRTLPIIRGTGPGSSRTLARTPWSSQPAPCAPSVPLR